MNSYTFTLDDFRSVGVEISETLFGANILFNRDNVDDIDELPGTGGTYDDVAEEIGITTIRYPGGAMSEWTFDLTNPDTPIHNFGGLDRFQPHGSNVDHLGLGEFLDYCAKAGLSMSFVMPTIRFLGGPENVDANGNRYEGISAEEADLIRNFTTSLLQRALEHGVDIQAIELGNEWYTDFTDLIGTFVTPVEYGRVASRIAMIVQGAIDAFVATRDLPESWVEPEIIAQLGHSVSDRATGAEIYSETEATLAIFSEFNRDAEKAALDGVLVHRYDAASFDLIEAMQNRNFSQFKVWDQLVAGESDFGEMSRYVTEWNISGNTTNTTGLECAAAMLELFSHMVRAGVDHANIWAVQQNNVSNLSGDEGSNELRVTGELFALMANSLVGLKLLDADSKSDLYEVTVFADDQRVVFYVASRSDEAITVQLEANSLIDGYTHVSGVVLGVVEGANPLHPAAKPELSHLTEDDLNRDGHLTIALDPYEISQVSFVLDGSGVELTGHDADDELVGSDSDDLMSGRGGNDIIFGRDGDDLLNGGAGNDRIYGGNGSDAAHGNDGNDHIQLGAGDDVAFGGAGNDSLYGFRNNDRLFGGPGDDILDGGENDDRLDGGSGNDTLFDGAGSDVMTGGSGGDRFVLSPSGGNQDVITDFEIGVDWIDVSAWGVSSFSQLEIEAGIDGASRYISVSSGANQVILEDLGLGVALSADDFRLNDLHISFVDPYLYRCSVIGLSRSDENILRATTAMQPEPENFGAKRAMMTLDSFDFGDRIGTLDAFKADAIDSDRQAVPFAFSHEASALQRVLMAHSEAFFDADAVDDLQEIGSGAGSPFTGLDGLNLELFW